MSVWSRSLVALAAGVALVGASGCSAGGTAEDPSTEPSATSTPQGLKKVDPCQILAPQDLEAIGLDGPGEPDKVVPWEPGCDYAGERVGLTLSKNTRQTVGSAAKKSGWAKFEKTEISGRSAAKAISAGSTEARICNILFNAGKGLIKVQVGDKINKIDECAKATEIAKRIAPEMPDPA